MTTVMFQSHRRQALSDPGERLQDWAKRVHGLVECIEPSVVHFTGPTARAIRIAGSVLHEPPVTSVICQLEANVRMLKEQVRASRRSIRKAERTLKRLKKIQPR